MGRAVIQRGQNMLRTETRREDPGWSVGAGSIRMWPLEGTVYAKALR